MSRLWNVGVNQAADAVVIAKGHVLLIKRGDNGQWAFPGGFLEKGDGDTENAAAREALEEAGIELFETGQLVFRGRVEDHRNEDDRWVETDAYLYVLDSMPPVVGDDDATDAAWTPLDVALGNIQATHYPLLYAALHYITES